MTNNRLAPKLKVTAKRALQPIDFTDLISKGLLKKEGAWYRFTNLRDLPLHVTDKIIEIKTTRGAKGGLAKFKFPSKWELKMLSLP